MLQFIDETLHHWPQCKPVVFYIRFVFVKYMKKFLHENKIGKSKMDEQYTDIVIVYNIAWYIYTHMYKFYN